MCCISSVGISKTVAMSKELKPLIVQGNIERNEIANSHSSLMENMEDYNFTTHGQEP